MINFFNQPIIKWSIGIAIAVIILWLISQLLVVLGGSAGLEVGTFHVGIGANQNA